MDAPLIEFQDVTKSFGPRMVLDRVNLRIHTGQVTTIIGLSGAGKSVLLKHIIGLLKPDSGRILFQGRPLDEMTGSERKSSLAQISYMFQDNALFDSLSVYDNIALPLRETTDLSRSEINRRVKARVEQMELADAVNKYPSELSGGMQKRAALARALVTDPRIVLFDEPTSGQDPIRKNAILGMIASTSAGSASRRSLSATRFPTFTSSPTASWPSTTGRWSFRERRRSWRISIIPSWMTLSAVWKGCTGN